MKILKRNYRQRNQIIFLILSLVFLQAIFSLSTGQTIYSTMSLRLFFTSHYLIIILTLITIFMVVNLKKYSEFAVLLCLSFIVGKNFVLLSASFNKLTLALNFIYSIFAFYFFVTWEMEIGLASFNPKFSKHDLEKETRFKVESSIVPVDNKEKRAICHVTNLDDKSCFLMLPKGSTFEISPSMEYILESSYEGVHFTQWARIVSVYDRGIGLIYLNDKNKRASWSELYKVCLERALFN